MSLSEASSGISRDIQVLPNTHRLEIIGTKTDEGRGTNGSRLNEVAQKMHAAIGHCGKDSARMDASDNVLPTHLYSRVVKHALTPQFGSTNLRDDICSIEDIVLVGQAFVHSVDAIGGMTTVEIRAAQAKCPGATRIAIAQSLPHFGQQDRIAGAIRNPFQAIGIAWGANANVVVDPGSESTRQSSACFADGLLIRPELESIEPVVTPGPLLRSPLAP